MTTAEDIALSERYLAQVRRLQEDGGGLLASAWGRLESWDEADIAPFASVAMALLAALGQSSAALTAGYIGLLAGERLGVPRLAIDQDVRHPFIGVWKALKEGRPIEEAVAAGRERAAVLASERVMLAQDQTARQAQRVTGWRRVPGGSTCSYCVVVSTQRYRTAEAARRVGHRNKGRLTCDCSVVPIVGERDPGRVINRPVLNAWKQAQRDDTPRYFDADALEVEA